jgi:hypothetical protein
LAVLKAVLKIASILLPASKIKLQQRSQALVNLMNNATDIRFKE